MEIKKLKQLIKLAKEENVVKLEFEDQDFKYAVTLGHVERPVVGDTIVAADLPKEEIKAEKKIEVPSGIVEVRSPFVGTFYDSPAPRGPSFVKVGDKVVKGQTLCILEAMKIMNEIDAEASGRIHEICVENESLVEYDQILFKIRK